MSALIDFVSLSQNIVIHHNAFCKERWHVGETKYGERCYWYKKRGVWIRYYPSRASLKISGKILMLLYDTQVLNVDDIYGRDIEGFVSEINAVLNKQFHRPIIDIRTFHVNRIDYCFNVETPYVKEYIAFFNKAFLRIGNELRKNYTQERGLTGSLYVRTASDYENNTRKNYCLNFYNKADRLTYQRNHSERVTEEDFGLAENILRLEVQCGYQMIRSICSHFYLNGTLGGMLSYSTALWAIATVYKRVLNGSENVDFYTYAAAKKLCISNEKAKETLYMAATNHSVAGKEYAYGRKMVQKFGVYPYCFLPKGEGLDKLENPIRLIENKISMLI